MRDLAELRCVVFGGGGFLGTNLCRALSGRVDTLRAFGRRKSFPQALSGVNWIPGDFADPAAVTAALDGCDTVFHLVTGTTPATSNTEKIVDVQANVVSTLHLLDACREARVRRVVYVSSGGTIYGMPKEIPTPEHADTDPITAYGITKLAIEKYLFLYQYLYGLEYRVLRLGNPYGPYQTALRNQGVVAAMLARALAGKPVDVWGDGSITRDYLYVDDVTEALVLAALHTGESRIFNIGSGQGRSLDELLTMLEQVLGSPIERRYLEGRKVDVPRSVLDVSLASRELRWQPHTNFATGLQKTVDWMRHHDQS